MSTSTARRRILGLLALGTISAALIAPATAFGVVEGGSPTPADSARAIAMARAAALRAAASHLPSSAKAAPHAATTGLGSAESAAAAGRTAINGAGATIPTTPVTGSQKSHLSSPALRGLGLSSGPTCANQKVLVSDGSVWTCSFDTEFTGTSLPSQWTPITSAASGFVSGYTACFVNSPNNISVGNGYLTLTAREEAAPFYCQLPFGGFTTQFTSGTVSTYGLFSQTYGRFEVRAEVPASAVAGLQSSFWLSPNQNTYGAWPNSGEIDIAETYSEYPGLAVPTIHYVPFLGLEISAFNLNTATSDTCTITPGVFNTYDVEWTPTQMTMIYNGKTCLIDHWLPMLPEVAPEPFNMPFFINLTQALGIYPNTFVPGVTELPASTEIQYVRAWNYAG